jgi:hypothetical protein
MSQTATTTLVYSPQCPNCLRFIDALRRTSAAGSVALVEVAQLTPDQLTAVKAVPALVTARGETLYGTSAFEWLKQYEGDVELEGFSGGAGLVFSGVDTIGYAEYAESFGPFEPVKD